MQPSSGCDPISTAPRNAGSGAPVDRETRCEPVSKQWNSTWRQGHARWCAQVRLASPSTAPQRCVDKTSKGARPTSRHEEIMRGIHEQAQGWTRPGGVSAGRFRRERMTWRRRLRRSVGISSRTRMDRGRARLRPVRTQGLSSHAVTAVPPPMAVTIRADRGERRWRAAQLAGLTEVPALVRDVQDSAALAMALIENIQREDLNPIEEAAGLLRLIDEFRMTHEQAADAVGRSRSATTNLLRLLKLATGTGMLIRNHRQGHARAPLGLERGAPGGRRQEPPRAKVCRRGKAAMARAWPRDCRSTGTENRPGHRAARGEFRSVWDHRAVRRDARQRQDRRQLLGLDHARRLRRSADVNDRILQSDVDRSAVPK